MPKVSVIMSVYNGERFLNEAVNSILQQTFTDFEFIIIDDGSQDKTYQILKRYKDKRLIILKNHTNRGIPYSLNKCLRKAQGDFIARQDADDISLPKRLEIQTSYLERYQNTVIVGSLCHIIDKTGAITGIWNFPKRDNEIRWMMLFHNSFVQSSAMFRAKITHQKKVFYDTKLLIAEDYELWSRLLKVGNGRNLNVPLVMYRLHDNQITSVFHKNLRLAASRVSQNNLKQLGLFYSIEDVNTLRKYFYCFPDKFNKEDVRICKLLLQIVKKFIEKNEINREFSNKLTSYWINKILYKISKKELLDLSKFGLFATMIALNTKCVLGHLVRRSKSG